METSTWRAAVGWTPAVPRPDGRASMVLVMGDRAVLEHARARGADPLGELSAIWAGQPVLGWSTAGQAIDGCALDDALVVAVVRFDATAVRAATAAQRTSGSARRAGRDIAETLAEPDLRVVLVAADGVQLNGSDIAAGITDVLPDVEVVGVLAADGTRASAAWTLVAGVPVAGHVCAIGLYGTQLEVGHGAGAGWTAIGPERLVTHALGNVVHTIDGRSARELYRDHLGPLADELLANSSMLPLQIRDLDDRVSVRSPGRFDDDGTVVMSGDVPQGAVARLLRAAPADLVHDAGLAAKAAHLDGAGLCLVVSTAGRRRVLGERAEDELDAVRAAVPAGTALVGCWSYGALGPTEAGTDVVDQAICVTTISERLDPARAHEHTAPRAPQEG